MTSVRADIVNELHRPARIHYATRKVNLRGLLDLYQADLIEMPYSVRLNKGFKYILVVINCFSKYVWCIPMKNKQTSTVSAATEHIFESSKVTPVNLQTDEGSEFMSRTFAALMKKYNVNHYQVYSNVKASICERVNRTIKEKLYTRFSLQGNYVWHNIIQPVVDEYNATKHSKTKLAPKDVTKDDERHLLETVYNYPTKIVKKCKFKVGDYVRLSKYRGPFVKGYLARWGTEQFRIVERSKQYPEKYKVEDKNGERILGSFYKEELQRIKHPNCFIVEKVLRRDKRKKQVLVKYLGLDTSHNEWINARDIL